MQHHVILASLDALRPDRMGCYGNERQLTPAMDDLAAESVLYSNAFTPATWTLPAHMSMLCGLDPLVHGCVSSMHQYPPERLPFPLVFELLDREGYRPHAAVGGGFVMPQFGFGRGVEHYHVLPAVGEAVLSVVQHAASAPLTFSFFHTYMVHDYSRLTTQPDPLRLVQKRDPDYKGFFPRDRDFPDLLKSMCTSLEPSHVSGRDVAYVRDLYDASVQSADLAVLSLVNRLRHGGLWEDTTLILTSDHGESLGEEHRGGEQHWFHGGPPYEELVRVPLLLRPAARFGSLLEPGEVEERVSLLDMVPTLLDLVSGSFSREQYDGLSLLELAAGQVAAFQTRRLFFHACEDPQPPKQHERLAFSAFTWKEEGKVFVETRSFQPRELYWLDTDAHETQNRLGELSDPELERIRATVQDYLQDTARRARRPEAVELKDEGVMRRLADLGYVDG